MDTELFNGLMSIITLVITIGGGFVFKFINQKIGTEKTKDYYETAKRIVMAIEQLNPELLGAEKKDLATSKLISLTKNTISSEQADLLIESAVYEIKKLLKNNNLE